jgi:hypothetical protein
MALSLAAAASQRVRIVPSFTLGETLRYKIETRMESSGKSTTPIENPQGGSQFKQTTSLILRLDVLDVEPGAKNAPGRTRLRATCEKSGSESESDAYDPASPSLDEQYRRLEGHSIEFTIEPTGEVTNFKGLDEIFPTRAAVEPLLSWTRELSSENSFPPNGIVIGQKWGNERPLTNTPLAGLVWRCESTYVRNEPCGGPGDTKATGKTPDATAGVCAVVLTRFEISRHGSANADATPEDYRRNGLRTSGKWTGSGEGLDLVSIARGLLVSSTQDSTQDMDYEIVSAISGARIHQVQKVTSHTEVTLVPLASPQS